jgi:hypothetical protein
MNDFIWMNVIVHEILNLFIYFLNPIVINDIGSICPKKKKKKTFILILNNNDHGVDVGITIVI